MRTRTLPGSELQVGTVGFGVWTVATNWWGITDRAYGIELLRRALDLGVNFFDTADTYDDGGAERILQEAFPGRRDEIVIATKFGYDIVNHAPDPNQRERPHNWEPAYVRGAVERSLQRLGTDRIDLYQMHNPRIDAILKDDLLALLEDLRSEGKIRSYGAALGPAIDVRQADESRAAIEETGMSSVQIIYNLLEQQVGAPIFGSARAHGKGILVRVPHASGLLEGNLATDTTFAPGDHRNWRLTTNERRRAWLERGLLKVERLAFLTEGTGRTIGQAAIQFILDEPSVVSVLPNIYDADQLAELAAASDTPVLTNEERERIAELVANDFGLAPDVAEVCA
ncbi:MAG: aldo/keto reductase [Armatimonadota bacterium]